MEVTGLSPAVPTTLNPLNYDFLVVFLLMLLTKAAIVWSALFLSSGLTTGFRWDKSLVDFL